MTETETEMKMSEKDLRDLVRFSKKVHTEYINTRDMETFLNLINGKIDTVIDVRWSTYYKTNQGFNPKEFKARLQSVGINYFYFQVLGNPFHKRHGLNEFVKVKQDYLKYIKKNSKAKKAFKELFSKFRFKKDYCLVCYCNTEDPLMCHRFWLKEALINYKRNKLDLPENYVLKKINNEEI